MMIELLIGLVSGGAIGIAIATMAFQGGRMNKRGGAGSGTTNYGPPKPRPAVMPDEAMAQRNVRYTLDRVARMERKLLDAIGKSAAQQPKPPPAAMPTDAVIRGIVEEPDVVAGDE